MARGPNPLKVELSNVEEAALEKCLRRGTMPQQIAQRVHIVRLAGQGVNNASISRELGVSVQRARRWRKRWVSLQGIPLEEMSVEERLEDEQRGGSPGKFRAEQVAGIIAIACEDPQASGYPVSHWAPKEVRAEAIRRGLVEDISERQVGRFLKRGGFETPSEPLLAQHQRKRPETISRAG